MSREPYDPVESTASSLRSIDETLEAILEEMTKPMTASEARICERLDEMIRLLRDIEYSVRTRRL